MPKKQAKKDRHLRKTIALRLPEDVWEAVRRQSERTRRTLTMEVQIALEQYLTAQGLWPPSKAEGQS